MAVEIGMVYLVDISAEYDLGSLSGTGYNGLHLVGCQVLRFINNEVNPHQTSAANVGKRSNLKFFIIQKFPDLSVVLIVLGELIPNDSEVIEKGLHIWVKFRVNISGEISYVLVREGDNGTGQINLMIAPTILYRCGHGEQGLSCSGLSSHGH